MAALSNRNISYQNLYETEAFWNQIMMEHAWFIRGLLDPSEAELIKTADDFSKKYAQLIETACRQDRPGKRDDRKGINGDPEIPRL